MSIDIDREGYLAFAARLKPEEDRLRQELMAWLPENIVDCHAHSNLPEHVTSMLERTRKHMLSTFPSYTLEESRRFQELFYPGKKVRTLRFPKTFRGVDHRAANDYLLRASPPEDRVALFGLPEDVQYTTSMLAHPRVSALKMYFSYPEPPATRVYEFFRPEILEEAQARDLPIILHPPRIIVSCREDVRKLLGDFPRLRVVLAHLGLTKTVVPGLAEAYAELAAFPQVYLDTSLVPSAEVVELALRSFGTSRVMFGSDEPLHLIRARAYVHPRLGQRLATDYPYHWADPDEQKECADQAKGIVHSHWYCLSAIREAVEAFPLPERKRIAEEIFCRNAAGVFGF